ncbi:MAG: PBP1A family penicillin-binding protein [Coriobacteriia bacterium]|nr:PBP1A family penicillin-binding protein [Coriobacteriia bacterium]
MKRTWLRVALALVAGTVGIAVLAAAGVLAFVAQSLQGLPDPSKPGAFRVAQPTKIYSADGKLLANFFLENREVVKLSQISSDLADAVVAVEDERFYDHTGIDTVGIVRAAIINLTTGTTKEGASTITQQYVRNSILADERYQNTLRRKIREASLAMDLEKRHSKADILELYLNAVYFGDGAYGAEAASRTYYGKSAADLTLAEASLLAGLPQSPNALNPYYNLAGAKARQAIVLERMVANNYITRQQADDAQSAPIVLTKTVDPNQGIYDCHFFVSYVRKQLLTQYPDSLVFKGGLKVYTTIDTRLQRYAEAAVRGTLGRPNDPDVGLASVDPRNGYIVAMYGGKSYDKNAYNTATQGRRQPGSAFKTFVLVTALEKGIPPRRPFNASSPAVIPTRPPWKVNNSEGSGKGAMTLAAATAGSVNVVFARLIWEIGARNVATTAKRMGITSDVPAYPAIALGGLPRGVSPLEMASAYGTLATGGVLNKPTPIIKIVGPDGESIYEHKVVGTQVLTKEISWATTQLLMGVVRSGTARRAALPGREVAGKTGTAQTYQDAWFCGYTPQLSTAVWMGYIKGSIPMRNVHGQRAFGGTFCAPMWRSFMVAALKGQPSLKFARAKPPHYIWKAEWSNVGTGTAKPAKPPGGGGGGGGSTTPTTTPSDPPTSGP